MHFPSRHDRQQASRCKLTAAAAPDASPQHGHFQPTTRLLSLTELDLESMAGAAVLACAIECVTAEDLVRKGLTDASECRIHN